MIKTTVKINGMACGMCESHINDVIRKTFPDAQKVTSSHTKAESSFVTESEIDADKLKAAIDETGYHYVSQSSEPYEKKGFLGGLFGRK